MEDIFELGSESIQELEQIRKALEVGYGTSPDTQTGFGATRLESLEKTLKYATEKENVSKFYKAVRKGKANSTVEEFTTMNEIGDANFYVEGGLPEEYDEDLRREFEAVKYVGAVGKVPNVARSVKSLADNVAIVQQAKAISIIRKLDIKMFFGNASHVSVEFNGYLTQFKDRVKNIDQNMIDMKGKHLTPEVLAEIGNIVEDNFGNPENLQGWIDNSQFKYYTDYLIADKRFFVNNDGVRDIYASARKFTVGQSSGMLNTDIHLKSKGQGYDKAVHPKLNDAGTAFAASHEKAPVQLDAQTFTATAGGTGGTIAAETYDYVAVPRNKYGTGKGFAVEDVAVQAGEKVTFVISDNGSPAGQQAESFDVYRRLASSTSLRDYKYVTTFKAGAASMVDDGSEIPGTTYGFFFDWDFDQVLDYKQLLPMVKMPLATVDDSIRWLQKVYSVPILYNPNKVVILKNLGSTSPS